MFLFILDSIGTPELILIGIIALMFLGPRKLPQIARTIGKTMADFRNTTNEFKATWQREVDFEDEIRAIRTGDIAETGPSAIPREEPTRELVETIAAPEIKPAQTELFDNAFTETQTSIEAEHEEVTDDASLEAEHEEVTDDASDKRTWL